LFFIFVEGRSGDLLKELQALKVRHGTERLNLALLHQKVGIGFGKAGTFQETQDFCFGGSFALQKEFILFGSYGSSEHDFVTVFQRKSVVGIVKDDFDKGIDSGGSGTFVK
jgi:hypothetical protein